MSIGYSGYGDSKTANLAINTSEPEAPKNFILKQMPEIVNNKAVLTFSFTRPTKSVLTLTEAQSDDEFSTNNVGATAAQVFNANVTVIDTATDLTGSLTAGNIIKFSAFSPYYYIISAITASEITLTYGLAEPLSASTDIYLCTKTAESSASSRAFRVNSAVGNSVNIYHIASDTTNKWTVTTTLGSFLDIDKVLATINEATRVYAKTQLFNAELTPAAITTATVSLANQTGVTASEDVSSYLATGDFISFGDNETFYEIQTVATTAITLTTNLLLEIPALTQIYKKKVMTDDPTPVAYEFPDYVNTSLIEFSGNETMTDLGGYELYMKTSSQTQGSLGTLIETIPVDDALLVNYNDGSAQYTFYADDDTFNGREMYFALLAYDTTMPTANKSLADLNAYVISIPTAVAISSVSLNIDTKVATINFGTITGSGKNPHMLVVMNNNAAQYSTRGGFDLYKALFVALDMGKGYYLGVDANNAKIVHPDILANDFVEVRDSISRHIWVGKATVNGSVDLNDTVKTFGTASISYLTGHSTLNITAKRAAISRTTSSVLPLTSDATPVKQYLTEYSNTYTVSNLTANAEYLFAMESIDTEITYS